MTRIVSKIASFFTRISEGCLSDSEIKDFVINKYKGLNIEQLKSEDIESGLIELKTNLAILGWIELDEPVQIEEKNNKETDRHNIVQSFMDLKNGKMIDQGIIAKGAGANLDWLDENNEDPNGFKMMALESILRFVEVKRKKIINAYSRELNRDEKIREGLRISILLSRASRRHDDLRYLNAALKMNDWYYPIFRKALTEKSLVYYLLALTEQERSSAEMLK